MLSEKAASRCAQGRRKPPSGAATNDNNRIGICIAGFASGWLFVQSNQEDRLSTISSPRANQGVSSRKLLERRMVVKEVLVAGGILLGFYGVYAVSRRIRQRWLSARLDQRNIEESTEPLLNSAPVVSTKSPTENIPTLTKRTSEDIQNTTKRPKPSPETQGTNEIGRSSENEEWREPTTTGADYGDMGSNGPVLSADITAQSSNLFLEVISGPSAGLRISQHAKERQSTSLTVGRIPQNDLVLNDPEVSGKHALISWNSKVSKWELVDMGSLNGTLVNYHSVAANHSLNAPIRQRGNPVGLVNGDIVTLGSTSQVLDFSNASISRDGRAINASENTTPKVRVLSGKKTSHFAISSTPFGVGIAADSMTVRRGGKQLPMEDVSLCEWPLRGFQECGIFCIFDGHGGAAAAEAASRLMPQKISNILSVEERRMKMLSQCDATDVLQDAFRETEADLEHEYEGCTATVLLIWWSESKEIYAQCANVGDSACAFSIGDKHIPMTEDHRLTSFSERCRLLEMGKQLKEGETRLCGMNIARALGDKFLKEQDGCFSSQPFVSEAIRIEPESKVLALIASDGLWDVMSQRRALNFIQEARDGKMVTPEGRKCPPQIAEGMAEMLVSKARSLRTKDNTSVIVLDFGSNITNSFRTV